MALYKERLKMQNKIRYNIWEALFPFNYAIYYVKKRKIVRPMFDRVIENMVHDALKRGQAEIRFYEKEGNVYFESMEELYRFYCEEYNLTGKIFYSKKIFDDMYTLLRIYFSHYEWQSPKDNGKKDLKFDIIEEEFEGENRRYIRIVLIGGNQ